MTSRSRPRRTRDLSAPEPSLDLSPMIDIVFNLLIFFLVATKFRTEEAWIQAFLPKDRGPGTSPSVSDVETPRIKLLWLDAAGRPTEGAEGHVVVELGAVLLGAPGELDGPHPEQAAVWPALHERLLELRANYRGASAQGLPVILDARPRVPTRHVVLALNEVVRAEVRDVTFAAPERPS